MTPEGGARLERSLKYWDLVLYGLAYIAPFAPLGTLGFVYSASTVPFPGAWLDLVFNDVVWWPVFWRFALEHAREHSRRGSLP